MTLPVVFQPVLPDVGIGGWREFQLPALGGFQRSLAHLGDVEEPLRRHERLDDVSRSAADGHAHRMRSFPLE